MRVTVTIPDEIAAEVEARGLTPESYVRGLIEEAARDAATRSGGEKRERDIQAFFREMAADSDKIPQLPDEALTRESFYQDRD